MGPRMAHIYELFFPEWNPDDLNTVQHRPLPSSSSFSGGHFP